MGAYHLVAPFALRYTYRFAAHCAPERVAAESLPAEVASGLTPRVAELARLGFEFLGYFDCGSLVPETRNYVAYFVNGETCEFASANAMVTPLRVASHLEFSTRFANGLQMDTNDNTSLPFTPGSEAIRVFRFPQLAGARALYRAHRRLVAKYAAGLEPVGEVPGFEITRWMRVAENYGPRHEKLGYMRLLADGSAYELSWKGAFLMALRGVWPVSRLRTALAARAMRAELASLELRDSTPYRAYQPPQIRMVREPDAISGGSLPLSQ